MILKIMMHNKSKDDKGNDCYKVTTHFIENIREIQKEINDKYRIAINEKGYANLYEVKERVVSDNEDSFYIDYDSSRYSRLMISNIYMDNYPENTSFDTKIFWVKYTDNETETLSTFSDTAVYLLNDNGQTIEKL